MAHAARAVVRIAIRIEVGDQRLHLVAGGALLHRGNQRGRRGIAGGKRRHFPGELMARRAVHRRLAGHAAQPDAHAVGEVAPLLGARLVDGLEAMRRLRVTGETVHLPGERVGFEMGAVARRGSNGLPVLARVAAHVAALAHIARHLGVRRNFLFPAARHPEDELDRLLPDLECMACMTAQGVMFPFNAVDQAVVARVRQNPGLATADKDVAPTAEAVVVLDKLVGAVAEASDQEQDQRGQAHEARLKSEAPRPEPVRDCSSVSPEEARQQCGHDRGQDGTAPHQPGRPLEDPLHDCDDGIGNVRTVDGGVDGGLLAQPDGPGVLGHCQDSRTEHSGELDQHRCQVQRSEMIFAALPAWGPAPGTGESRICRAAAGGAGSEYFACISWMLARSSASARNGLWTPSDLSPLL